jgi:hypothetical protein
MKLDEIDKIRQDIDEKIKELESKEHPNLSLINSLKAKKAMLKHNIVLK